MFASLNWILWAGQTLQCTHFFSQMCVPPCWRCTFSLLLFCVGLTSISKGSPRLRGGNTRVFTILCAIIYIWLGKPWRSGAFSTSSVKSSLTIPTWRGTHSASCVSGIFQSKTFSCPLSSSNAPIPLWVLSQPACPWHCFNFPYCLLTPSPVFPIPQPPPLATTSLFSVSMSLFFVCLLVCFVVWLLVGFALLCSSFIYFEHLLCCTVGATAKIPVGEKIAVGTIRAQSERTGKSRKRSDELFQEGMTEEGKFSDDSYRMDMRLLIM